MEKPSQATPASTPVMTSQAVTNIVLPARCEQRQTSKCHTRISRRYQRAAQLPPQQQNIAPMTCTDENQYPMNPYPTSRAPTLVHMNNTTSDYQRILSDRSNFTTYNTQLKHHRINPTYTSATNNVNRTPYIHTQHGNPTPQEMYKHQSYDHPRGVYKQMYLPQHPDLQSATLRPDATMRTVWTRDAELGQKAGLVAGCGVDRRKLAVTNRYHPWRTNGGQPIRGY